MILLLTLLLSTAHAGDFKADTLKFMDNLKTCTPHTFSYAHPMMKGFTGKNIIKGKKGSKCEVSYLMPGDMKMDCAYSSETVKYMTSEQKYKEAREGTSSGSVLDANGKKMADECKF